MGRHGWRRYLTGSVPISIGLHLVALILCFVVPLTARIVLPIVSVDLPEYVLLAPMPPPPAVLVRSAPPPAGAAPSRASVPAPTFAPSSIHPEDLSPPTIGAVPTPGASDGVPSGMTESFGTGLSTSLPMLPPQAPSGPVRVADLPVAPRKTNDARPAYPDIARKARIAGTVVMEAVLDPTGRVTQLRVIQSVPLLDQAALDAVRQWRYTPSTYGGRPVSVLMTITVRFTLE